MRLYPVEAREHNAHSAPVPLSDEQLRHFIAAGYLPLQSSLPSSYHRLIFERFDQVSQSYGHFGNNLLPLVPELGELFEDPIVKGALQTVLGKDYSMHPHRALHSNPPGTPEQGFHKDSYWGYVRRVRNHRPWWVMIMYFPQSTPVKKGPTAVMRGSQHLNQQPNEYCVPASISGKAGSLVMIHYDIWHRKMLNQTELNRYMFKFEFTRLRPPEPTDRGSWISPKRKVKPDLSPVWESVWDWVVGRPSATDSVGDEGNAISTDDLGASDEWRGIRAGYELASFGKAAIGPLLNAMHSNPSGYNEKRRYSDNGLLWRDDAIARNAAHGLVSIGRPAINGLLDTLDHGGDRARKHAAFALGEIGDRSATDGLDRALQDDEVHVRVAAIEALGLLKPSNVGLTAMLAALRDPASEVRFDAALSLMRASTRTSAAMKAKCVSSLGAALYDTNRYVSGYAAEALERIGTKAALAELLPFLRTSRWCAHTDNQHPF